MQETLVSSSDHNTRSSARCCQDGLSCAAVTSSPPDFWCLTHQRFMSLYSMYWLQVLPGTALTLGLRLMEGAPTTWVITSHCGREKGGLAACALAPPASVLKGHMALSHVPLAKANCVARNKQVPWAGKSVPRMCPEGQREADIVTRLEDCHTALGKLLCRGERIDAML